jgi:iron complex outermembrane recepter protein
MNPRDFMPTAVMLAATALCAPAWANDSTFTLGELVVTAGRVGGLTTRSILSSVDIVAGEQLQGKQVPNSWELLGQMPGVQLTEFRMGAESGKATFRAFNGEGYINGIKVLIDGVPSNVNSGNQRFIDMVPPLDLALVEVVRGTNDPRYGLHNIGGNIDLVTRQGGHYTEGRLALGSFDTLDAQVALGRESGDWAQNYILAGQTSSGHRPHSDSGKYTLGAKWFYSLPQQRIKAGLALRAQKHDADEPGYLTRDELAQDRFQSPAKNANDRSSREMSQVTGHLDWQLSDRAFVNTKAYVNRYDDDRRITFTSNPTGSAPRQRRVWSEVHTGWMGTLTWRESDMLTVDGGVNLERQDNAYKRYRFNASVPTDFDGTPERTQNDDSYTLNNVGAYIQAIVQPSREFKFIPAFRSDRFTGSTRLNLTGVTGSLQDVGWIHQPKLSMVYSPQASTSVYANWGKTFQILTGSRAPAYLTPGQAKFDPSINTGTELGIKYKPAAHTEMRVAIWRQDATDEVANMPSTGTTVGLGQTRRQGLDLQASTRVFDGVQLWASHAIQEAKVVAAFNTAGASLAGKEVFSTPRYISNIGADWQLSEQWQVGAQARAQGSYHIDDLNAQGKFGGFALLDAQVKHAFSPNASLELQVKNLTNRRYEYVWFDNFFWPAGSEQAMFSPGAGRSAYLALSVKY